MYHGLSWLLVAVFLSSSGDVVWFFSQICFHFLEPFHSNHPTSHSDVFLLYTDFQWRYVSAQHETVVIRPTPQGICFGRRQLNFFSWVFKQSSAHVFEYHLRGNGVPGSISSSTTGTVSPLSEACCPSPRIFCGASHPSGDQSVSKVSTKSIPARINPKMHFLRFLSHCCVSFEVLITSRKQPFFWSPLKSTWSEVVLKHELDFAPKIYHTQCQK